MTGTYETTVFNEGFVNYCSKQPMDMSDAIPGGNDLVPPFVKPIAICVNFFDQQCLTNNTGIPIKDKTSSKSKIPTLQVSKAIRPPLVTKHAGPGPRMRSRGQRLLLPFLLRSLRRGSSGLGLLLLLSGHWVHQDLLLDRLLDRLLVRGEDTLDLADLLGEVLRLIGSRKGGVRKEVRTEGRRYLEPTRISVWTRRTPFWWTRVWAWPIRCITWSHVPSVVLC